MISSDIIKTLYKKYRKRPQSIDSLDIAQLFTRGAHHDLIIDPDTEDLYIGSIPEDSPFHIIPLRNVNAIVPFEEWIALVMHSSILFLNTKDNQTNIHIKMNDEAGFFSRIFGGS